MNMNWVGLVVLLAIVVGMLLLRRAGQVSAQEAREWLRKGALVVDVRTAGEFENGHLPQAINIPVDEIGMVLPRRFPNRDKAILLHCQSGMRSGVARRQLRALGYQNAFNLGSYGRAMQIVTGRG
jgi:phage shock protein E